MTSSRVKCWTEARYWQFIRSALRKAWLRYPNRFEILSLSRRPSKRKGLKWEYQCASCKEWFKSTDVQVDHKTPAGQLKSYDECGKFIDNLFCETENLNVLCKPCHQIKTKKEREK